jgi:hypothetical protein
VPRRGEKRGERLEAHSTDMTYLNCVFSLLGNNSLGIDFIFPWRPDLNFSILSA